MTPEEATEHNRLFTEASSLVSQEIPLHDRPDMPAPGFWLRRKLNRALKLFVQVMQLNPGNWSAMWLSAKVYQRLGDRKASLDWFGRSYQINPSQPDVAREAAMSAMDVGENDLAITYAFRATQIAPSDNGLQANLALAYLLANRTHEAQATIALALNLNPKDSISQTVAKIIYHFAANGRTPPHTTPSLLEYWRRNKNK